jgi:lambda family phage portal protein
LIAEAEAGQFEELPSGVNFQAFDPTHPSGNYAPFIKAALRGVASGLNVSYNTLANDLEGVNYSSIRAGLLEEREEWKTIQGWLIEHVISRIFEEWLPMAMLSGKLELPANKIDKFTAVEWRGRRWPWVDPLKDVQASILSVNNGFKSRRRIIAEGGGDIEDTVAEIAEDKQLANSKGLSFPFPQSSPSRSLSDENANE